MANGWNLWVCLVSVVVRRYIYYRYPHNNYYFPLLDPLVLKFFLAVSSVFLCSFLNVFLDSMIIMQAKCFLGRIVARPLLVKFDGAREE